MDTLHGTNLTWLPPAASLSRGDSQEEVASLPTECQGDHVAKQVRGRGEKEPVSVVMHTAAESITFAWFLQFSGISQEQSGLIRLCRSTYNVQWTPFLPENVSHWDEEKAQPSNTSTEKWGSHCGTARAHNPAGWCCWICAIPSVVPPPGGGMKRENTGWNYNKENSTPHTKYHRTTEGKKSDTAEIQSHFLSRCFVSIQVNKQFFKKVYPASQCRHIKCTPKPASSLLFLSCGILLAGRVCTASYKPILVLNRQTCSESVRYGQFGNIKVKKWNGGRLVDSRYKNHQ